jgi:hypothetical protein
MSTRKRESNFEISGANTRKRIAEILAADLAGIPRRPLFELIKQLDERDRSRQRHPGNLVAN